MSNVVIMKAGARPSGWEVPCRESHMGKFEVGDVLGGGLLWENLRAGMIKLSTSS